MKEQGLQRREFTSRSFLGVKLGEKVSGALD